MLQLPGRGTMGHRTVLRQLPPWAPSGGFGCAAAAVFVLVTALAARGAEPLEQFAYRDIHVHLLDLRGRPVPNGRVYGYTGVLTLFL